MTKPRRMLLVALLCRASLLPDSGQTVSNPLEAVKRIYVVEDFGKKADSAGLRRDLMNDLKRSKVFDIVNSADQADAVLTGSAEVYVRSYFSLNPRAGVSPNRGEPIYGGSLSVELKDKKGETVWSYLVAARSGMTEPSRELAKEVVKHLVGESGKAGKR